MTLEERHKPTVRRQGWLHLQVMLLLKKIDRQSDPNCQGEKHEQVTGRRSGDQQKELTGQGQNQETRKPKTIS